MGLIVGFLCAIAISILGRVFADEFKAFRPMIVDYLVRRAVGKLPRDMHERYEEEWRSYLLDVPGDIAQVLTALGYNLVADRLSMPFTPWEGYAKRLIDVAFASAALFFLAPLFAILGAMIWAHDGKSPFYSHRRIGRHGVTFGCLKFRTMYLHGDQMLARHLSNNSQAREEWMVKRRLENDPRITPIGKVLRKTSLDELPQLINVLRGDMSLTGPRPIVASEIERYGDKFSTCFSVRPGITGLWQISGKRDSTYEERVKADLEYVENWSFWDDILIILRTVPAVFTRKKRER